MANHFVVLFTQTGYDKIQNEYDELSRKRPEVVAELTYARDMGDRSENAAYKSARRKLSGADSRLRFLKKLIDNARIVKATQDEYVEIGSVVTVYNGKEEHIFYIVGEYESDPATGRLSYRSPVGQALLRRRSGETAEISTPSGILSYEIRGIRIA